MSNDLISRAALIQLIEAKMNIQGRDYDFGDGLHCGLETALGIVESAPTLEPQVVHGSDLIDLYVKDRLNGRVHRVGTDQHDSLLARNGVIYYYNLQNGCGTLEDGGGEYEFVDSDCGERMDAEEAAHG